MPRFVILEHELPSGERRGTHWDLMLEQTDGLRTWALETAPARGVRIAAEELPVHRREYLDYEGPVSGNRGSVAGWDRGDFRWVDDDADALVIELAGTRVTGRVRLERVDQRSGEPSAQRWEFAWGVA
jgi:hypothetical protein